MRCKWEHFGSECAQSFGKVSELLEFHVSVLKIMMMMFGCNDKMQCDELMDTHTP